MAELTIAKGGTNMKVIQIGTGKVLWEGANLRGADLYDANLRGANLYDANLIVGGQRSDGYVFFGYKTDNGLMIRAGCRYFSKKDAIKHWKATRKGTALGKESLALVECLVACAKAAGWKI